MANGLLDGLLLALLLDEATGSADRVDASANGNDVPVEVGSILGFTPGVNGGAQNFGTDEGNRLARADDGTFDLGSAGSFSVGAWFRQAGSQTNPFISKTDGLTNNLSWRMRHRTSNNRVRFEVSDDGITMTTLVEPASGTTPLNVWNLVTAGFDFAAQEIWIQLNGVARNTVAHTTGIFQAAPAELTVGWDLSSIRVMGNQDQDETYVWDRLITSEDHLAMYDSGTGLFFSSFDAGSGGSDDEQEARFFYYSRRGRR